VLRTTRLRWIWSQMLGAQQKCEQAQAHLCSGATVEGHLVTATRFASPSLSASARPLHTHCVLSLIISVTWSMRTGLRGQGL